MPQVISEQTKDSVNHIFTQAAKTNLKTNASDVTEVEMLRVTNLVETPETKIVILTVASYLFRLLTIFHVNLDKVTQDYFASAAPEKAFDEVFGELGNLCCGAMNRELGKHFRHTGMSTPYMLESKCMPFLQELKPTYVSQHKIEINSSVVMHASLCLCAYAPIDFRMDTTTDTEETGVLELF